LKELKFPVKDYLWTSAPLVSYGPAKFWLLALDDCPDHGRSNYLNHGRSNYLKKKSDLCDKMIALIKDLKAKQKITFKYIRCNDAGKNKMLEEVCLKVGLGIQFEYTAPSTPQRNGHVERKFTTLNGCVRATMDSAGLPEKLRKGLWAECAKTMTITETIIVTTNKPVSSYSHFFEKEPEYA
jgi:hypothetical protein